MEYQLTDLNGEVWDFGDDCPLQLRYVRGIDGAEFGLDTIQGVDQRGVTVVGSTFKAGVIELGVYVWPGRIGILGADAVDLCSRWRDGLGEGEVERADRRMEFRIVDSGRFQVPRLLSKPAVDWEKVRYAGFWLDEIKLQSDESDWRRDPLPYTFTAAQFATASIENNGTVDSWPWFKLTGPITNPILGFGGYSVKLPNLAAGQWLTIDTDPNWYAVNDQSGLDRTYELYTLAAGGNDRWYAPAAARSDSIAITMTGGGTTAATSLEVRVPQIFRSAV